MNFKFCRDEKPEYCPVRIDWTDSERYPKPEDLTLNEWAWEFLRRNPEYIKDWEHFNQLPDYAKFEDGQTTNKIGKSKGNPYSEFTLDCFYSNPPALPGEKMEDYEERMLEQGNDDYIVEVFADYLYGKYNFIGIIPDPSAPLPRYITFTDEFGKDETFPLVAPNVYNYLNPGDLFIFPEDKQKDEFIEACKREYSKEEITTGLIFDPLQPIDKQLEIAKRILLDEREILLKSGYSVKGSFKVRLNEYPIYIQILDAMEQLKEKKITEKYDAIAKEIMSYKENKKPDYIARDSIRKNHEAAKKLRDHNYWLIPNINKK